MKFKLEGGRIKEINIVRETACFVFLTYEWNGQEKLRREAKETENHTYFDTWSEAHKKLINELECNVISVKWQLDKAERALVRAKQLKEPDSSNDYSKSSL